jgi:hypothetical protein
MGADASPNINHICIAKCDWHNNEQPFYIKNADRFGHIYSIGKTGVGKSTLLLNMAVGDIQNGNGICVIDPHGDLAGKILNSIPTERAKDVIYFNPEDLHFPVGFNPLYTAYLNSNLQITSGLISTFKKIWVDSWGPRLEHILRHCIQTLLEYPGATLLDIQPLLTDAAFRSRVLFHVQDSSMRSFWYNEFNKYTPAFRSEAISPILNKVGLFSASPILRNIFGQQQSSFDMHKVMGGGKILICNLSKGLLGEDVSTILGSFIVTAIQLAALNRASIPEEDRRPFFLYVDEMHSFVSLSFADMLAEVRKYKLGLFLTHQYIEQLQAPIRAAIFGTVGTMIAFRLGAADAQDLAREFQPVFNEADLISLPRYSMYIKLMIDGATSRPFSAQTMPPPQASESYKEQIIEFSQKKYGRAQTVVEREVFARHQSFGEYPFNRNLFETEEPG